MLARNCGSCDALRLEAVCHTIFLHFHFLMASRSRNEMPYQILAQSDRLIRGNDYSTNFPCPFFREVSSGLVLRGPNYTKFWEDVGQSSASTSLFRFQFLFRFERRATQRRLGRKIEAEFLNFSPQ